MTCGYDDHHCEIGLIVGESSPSACEGHKWLLTTCQLAELGRVATGSMKKDASYSLENTVIRLRLFLTQCDSCRFSPH